MNDISGSDSNALQRVSRLRRRIASGGILAGLILLLGLAATAVAQPDVIVILTEPDTAQFPTARLRVMTADDQSAPLPEDQFASLALRENGVPVADFDLQFVPVGIDAVFVLDADETMAYEDGAGGTRLDQVKESIRRYANRFMSPAGLDRISIVVPDGADGRFLIQNESNPQAVIAAIDAYNPALPEDAPVNEMLQQAIARLDSLPEEDRFQTILLYSDGNKLSQQLDYPALAESPVPIYTAVLGGLPTQAAIGNADALSAPTRAFYLTMPFAEESDPVFLLWQRQGNQPQISYQSFLRESGRYPVSVNIGPLAASVEMDLTLEAPQVALQLAEPVIRRAGDVPDTPLEELQPGTVALPVQIVWPDGIARELTAVTFTVNGQMQPQLTTPQPDENGVFQVEWPAQTTGTGAYDLQVSVEDALGFTAVSEAQVVTVVEERPSLPTPTPAPTPTPLPAEVFVEEAARLPRQVLLLLLAGLGLLAIALVLLRLWQKRGRQKAAAAALAQRQADLQAKTTPPQAEETPPAPPLPAFLVWSDETEEAIEITGDNVLIGRDPAVVDIALADRSVSRLHARIRWRNGRYWLYDEGSEMGTFLNHDRLGLSPKPLQDGDEVRFGRVGLRFEVRG
ncbi:MAG TPA: FHA domain-containing protein [Chloroflexi bacterium]|nr:FHA domain-containing protein [Chloroflexota bacterium]